ncbi:MAG: EipB family protein [Hyphomicrobiales bacterium]
MFKFKKTSHAALLAAALCAGAAVATSSDVFATEYAHVVPHRAFYTLSADKIEERSGVRSAGGRMVIEITGNRCDGWAVNVRFATALGVQRGQTRVLDNVDSYFEAGDGSKFKFSSRFYINGNLEKETKGEANLTIKDGASEGGEVELEQPTEIAFKLPKGTLFPMAHTEKLLKLATRGETFDRVQIYDGDGDKTVYFASTVIGKKKEGLSSPTQAQKPLKGVAYWPVSISYYDRKTETYSAGEQVPSHQVGFTMFENGVSGSLTIDYGDFSLKGELEKLEMLEEVSCD